MTYCVDFLSVHRPLVHQECFRGWNILVLILTHANQHNTATEATFKAVTVTMFLLNKSCSLSVSYASISCYLTSYNEV